MVQFPFQEIEHLIAVRMNVRRIALPRLDLDEAERLLRIRPEFSIAQPLDRTPFEVVGQFRIHACHAAAELSAIRFRAQEKLLFVNA
jgi:hypothetical protein